MKKNKTVAFMLATILMVGGTFLGTKALFEDQETADTDLVITTGKLDLEVQDIGWYLTAPGTEGEIEGGFEEMGNKEFKNLKPGDEIYKQFVVQNEGTLDLELAVTGGVINKQTGPFEIEVKDLRELNEMILQEKGNPKDHDGFAIKITISEDWEGQDMEFDLADHMSKIVIDAKQTTAR